jgi:uncharacterized RDD family membrane protein YckC
MESGDAAAWGEWAMPGHAAPPPGEAPVHFAPPTPPRANPDHARNRRVLATLIDLGVLGLGYLVAASVAPAGTDWAAVFTELPMGLIVTAAALVYFTVLEGAFGQTLGKSLCDVRVVDGRHHPAGFGRSAIRSLLRPIDHFLLGAVGAICVIATGPGKRQRVGDAVAGTYVVRASQTPLPRAADGTIALVGIALALVPLILFAPPIAGAAVPISDEYQAKQVAGRYLTALANGNAGAACEEMSAGFRRALIAMDNSAGASKSDDCNAHRKAVLTMVDGSVRLGARMGSLPKPVTVYGDVAWVRSGGGDQVVVLSKEGGAWRVDPEARERHGFVQGCAATGVVGEPTCGCMFDALRFRGVDPQGVVTDLRGGAMTPTVQEAAAGCGFPMAP